MVYIRTDLLEKNDPTWFKLVVLRPKDVDGIPFKIKGIIKKGNIILYRLEKASVIIDNVPQEYLTKDNNNPVNSLSKSINREEYITQSAVKQVNESPDERKVKDIENCLEALSKKLSGEQIKRIKDAIEKKIKKLNEVVLNPIYHTGHKVNTKINETINELVKTEISSLLKNGDRVKYKNNKGIEKEYIVQNINDNGVEIKGKTGPLFAVQDLSKITLINVNKNTDNNSR